VAANSAPASGLSLTNLVPASLASTGSFDGMVAVVMMFGQAAVTVRSTSNLGDGKNWSEDCGIVHSMFLEPGKPLHR